MPRLNVLKNRGFTLLETLVVILILGIGFAIATPSFLSSMEKLKLEQAVVEVRSTLRSAQKQAIRQGEACFVAVDLRNSQLTAPCISIGERSLPKQVKMATNISLAAQEAEVNGNAPQQDGSYLVASTELNNLQLANLPNSLSGVKVGICINKNGGSKTFCIQNYKETGSDNEGSSSPKIVVVNFGILGTAEFNIVKPNLPASTFIDPTAKIVFYTNGNSSQKKCIAISNTLGLTRAGSYTGTVDPVGITTSGVCKATE